MSAAEQRAASSRAATSAIIITIRITVRIKIGDISIMSSDPLIPRRGFIEISAETAKTNPSLLLRIQADMAVNDTSINHVTDTFRMYGKSPQFDQLEDYQIAPAYDWHFAPNGAVKYSRK